MADKDIFVRIRGIYATALTKLLGEEGFVIADPSECMKERFGMAHSPFFLGVRIKDKDDKHGVCIIGEKRGALSVLSALKRRLGHLVIRERRPTHSIRNGRIRLSALFEQIEYEVDFPYSTKKILDKIRAEVCNTMEDHHRFRIIDTELVDRVEAGDGRAEEMLKEKLKFKEGDILEILHIRPEGEVFRIKDVKIERVENEKLYLHRIIKGGGIYNGLCVKKEEGDFCITEIEEGSWITKHAYFTKEGRKKGEFYNINTAAEFYPLYIRYIDLHIDVVKTEDGKIKVLDEEKLDRSLKSGIITPSLYDEAKKMKERVLEYVKD